MRQVEKKQLIVKDRLIFHLSPSDLLHIPSIEKTTIGIRAEHIYPATAQETNVFLDVSSVEQLGNETMPFFYFPFFTS